MVPDARLCFAKATGPGKVPQTDFPSCGGDARRTERGHGLTRTIRTGKVRSRVIPAPRIRGKAEEMEQSFGGLREKARIRWRSSPSSSRRRRCACRRSTCCSSPSARPFWSSTSRRCRKACSGRRRRRPSTANCRSSPRPIRAAASSVSCAWSNAARASPAPISTPSPDRTATSSPATSPRCSRACSTTRAGRRSRSATGASPTPARTPSTPPWPRSSACRTACACSSAATSASRSASAASCARRSPSRSASWAPARC